MTEIRKECYALLAAHAVELRQEIEREVDGLHCEGAEAGLSQAARKFLVSMTRQVSKCCIKSHCLPNTSWAQILRFFM